MEYALMFACFLLAGCVAAAAAITGYKGAVCDRFVGYGVPARVESDPRLNKKANELVARWCTIAAALSLVAVVALVWALIYGSAPLNALHSVGVAAYGFLVVVVGSYPFEKIKHLAENDQSD